MISKKLIILMSLSMLLMLGACRLLCVRDTPLPAPDGGTVDMTPAIIPDMTPTPSQGTVCLEQPCDDTHKCKPELYCNPVGRCVPIKCSSSTAPNNCTALGMTCDLNHRCVVQKGQRCDDCSRQCNTITHNCVSGVCFDVL